MRGEEKVQESGWQGGMSFHWGVLELRGQGGEPPGRRREAAGWSGWCPAETASRMQRCSDLGFRKVFHCLHVPLQ